MKKILAALRVVFLCLIFTNVPSFFCDAQAPHYLMPATVKNPRFGGHWWPDGRNGSGPLTTIVKWPATKTRPAWTYSDWRMKVGNKLISTANTINTFRDQFLTIKTFVDGKSPTAPNIGSFKDAKLAQANRDAAKVAKFAAFLFFLNIKVTSSGMPATYTFSDLPSADSADYKAKAMAYLNCIQYNFEGKVITTDDMQYESQALVMALEAFDLLTNVPPAAAVDTHWASEMKLALQYMSRNMFIKADDLFGGVFSTDNNHTLLTASALSLAATVLHDCGGDWTCPNYQPDVWANKCNFEIENTLFRNVNPQTSPDGRAGYSEGPYYFYYAMENMIPMMIAYNNYLPGGSGHTYFPNWPGPLVNLMGSIGGQSAFKPSNPNGFLIPSYFFNGAYHNLMEWYARLIMPNGNMAPIDDSYNYANAGAILNLFYDGTKQEQSFNWFQGQTGGQDYTGLTVEYIANSDPPPSTGPALEPNFNFANNGIGVLQNQPYSIDPDTRIELIALAQRGTNTISEHKHADIGSFLITAGQDQLIIDPGYLGYDDRTFTNQGVHHNVITTCHHGLSPLLFGPDQTSVGTLEQQSTSRGELSLKLQTHYANIVSNRLITSFKLGANPWDYFYLVHDDAFNNGPFLGNLDFQLNINGSGNINDGTFAFIDSAHQVFDYTYHCTDSVATGTHWNIRCGVAVIGGNISVNQNTSSTFDATGTLHSDKRAQGLTTKGLTGTIATGTCTSCSADHFGVHTQVQVVQTDLQAAHFVSAYVPYICGTTPPTLKINNSIPSITVTIDGTSIDVFFFTPAGGSTHTLTDPFDTIGIYGNLSSNGTSIGFSEIPTTLRSGHCTAYTTFRSASMDSGTTLTFQDTDYIQSPGMINAGYTLTGKCRYSGWAYFGGGGTDDIKFFLPDTLYNGHFIAIDGNGNLLPSTYDSINKTIVITFDTGHTTFTIQLDNPCLLNCYFPSTAETIDSVFNFDTGLLEYLGHDLDVNQDTGRLNIINGSMLSICSGHYLSNIDTIYMHGYMDAGDSFSADRHDTCNGDLRTVFPYFHNTNRLNSGRAMIIVNNGAALVFENGSHTIMDANSTILIKKGGTLYVQSGAHVTIGGPSQPGYAEIVAEDSAFVCIEPGADIGFYANPHDSSDKNILYLPAGYRSKYAIADKYTTMSGHGIFDAGGRYSMGPTCTAICSLKDNSVVQNPQYGWFNAGAAFAYIDAPDTMCLGDTMAVSSRYSRNVSWFTFKVCDTVPGFAATCTDLDVCDTGRSDYCNLAPKYTWLAQHTYKLTLKVYNECGNWDTTSRLIYVVAKPVASFTLPDSACPGLGTFTANGSASTNSAWHQWTVEALNPASDLPSNYDTLANPGGDTSYIVSGAVSSSFTFPGFRFVGGRKYIITLTVYNHCGTSIHTKLINIPLGASILNPRPVLIYASGVGPLSVVLLGSVTGQDSFSWKSKLASGGSYGNATGSNVLSKTVSPTSATYYVLRAKNGSCLQTDTILVKVNLYANAGHDTTICRGDSAYLGMPGVTLPSGWYAFWLSTYNISNPYVYYTKARPDSTFTYKLVVNNSLDVTVETDTKTIYVDTLPVAGFSGQYSGRGYNFCFDNESYPYSSVTRYKWHFGDGDSSSSANPCHTYAYVGHDTTYAICLKITNSCGDSTLCDSLFLPADSNLLTVVMRKHGILGGTWVQTGYTTVISNPVAKEASGQTTLFTIAPNPTTGFTTVHYQLNSNEQNGTLIMFDLNGKTVKSYVLNQRKSAIDIDLANVPSGIYPAYIKTDSSVSHTAKIVITRP